MMRRMGRPLDGRSRSVLVYRLWIREDAIPQEGQAAVGDIVRRVSIYDINAPGFWRNDKKGKRRLR